MRRAGATAVEAEDELVEIGLKMLAAQAVIDAQGLCVRLVVSDAHEGLKAAIARVLNSSWQRCRVGLLKKPPFLLGQRGTDCDRRPQWGTRAAGVLRKQPPLRKRHTKLRMARRAVTVR
jgi:hypothetical protein